MNINRRIGFPIVLIVIVALSYYGYSSFIAIKNQHHNNLKGYGKYLWILYDSVKQNVDSVFFVGLERKPDSFYEYIIDNPDGKQFITICHLKNIDNADLETISFNQNISIDAAELFPAEKFNLESKVRPEVTICSKLPYKDSLSVNLNSESEIIKLYHSEYYSGFFGNINKMLISNDKGENLILFDYGHRKQQTLFLFYKKNGSLFFILVNSEKSIDESIMNILNLNSITS
jgi:hypothetical protein